ncbi:UNVERIFIED_CONTAM: hypothetical protein RMT77_007027 [Armadillidium vulgare]
MTSFDQIQDFSCPICFCIFSERDNIPYALSCGHTHCHKCLNNLVFSNNNLCGKCRKVFPFDFARSLPINYTLLGAIESLQSTFSKNEMIEFKEVEKKIDSTIDKLNDSKTKYNIQIQELKKKIEEIDDESKRLIEAKTNLKKAKNNLFSNSILESMDLMGKAVSSINNLHAQSQIISDRLDRVEQIKHFQSFFDFPQEFFISSEKISEFTTYFTSGNLMYVNSFPQELPSKRDCEIKMNDLRPFIKKAFIKFGYGRCSSLVEFEFFDNSGTRAKHFIERCIGEENLSFRKADIYKHDRVGAEGESFCIGINGDNGGASSLNSGCRKMDYIKSGYITAGANTKRVNHFKIYLESWHSKSCYPCFGRVTKGLNSLKSATKNKLELRVLECGVTLDFVNE